MRMVKGYKGLYAFGITMVPQHILRLMKAGKFPPCRKIGNVCWWIEAELLNWMRDLPKPSTLPKGE